jgi:peptidoglycan/LPS O-acetylase OafA/YrhL
MQQVKSQGRLQWVDYARGIAIMLVVYRHVVIGAKRSGFEISSLMFNIQEVFLNFRMPVFFMLSGIFIAGSLVKKSKTLVLKDRASTLLYTYLLWAGITMVLLVVFSRFTNAHKTWADLIIIITKPRETGHLWYLLALFNTSALFLLLNRIKTPAVLHLVLAVAMLVLARMPVLQHFSVVSDLFYFYLYFLLGTYISPVILDRERGPDMLKPKKLYWLAPLFIVAQIGWYLNKDEEANYYFTIPFFIINIIACYFVYVLSNLLSRYRSNDWLAFLGRYSLYIYILHVYLATMAKTLMLYLIPDINTWVLVITCTAVGLIGPIILYNLLKGVGIDKLFSLKTKSVA